MTAIRNSRAAYGWAAIGLHWISAVGVTVLYFLGEAMEDAPDRAAKIAAQNTHVSVAVLLFAFLAARILWSLSQPKPEPLEANVWLQRLAKVVQWAFLLMIAVQLVTGPLAVWSTGRAIGVFDLFAIPSPFGGRVGWLHEAAETIHGLSAKLFWPLIALHLAGAAKHLVLDRDRTLQRMLWVRKS